MGPLLLSNFEAGPELPAIGWQPQGFAIDNRATGGIVDCLQILPGIACRDTKSIAIMRGDSSFDNSMRNMFITFEGIEGSGKSLQISRTEDYLRQRGIACVVTREPGGTEFGRAVRQVLLGTGGAMREPVGELLLYLADRYQHLKEVIEPALLRGLVVVSDRYHDATLAYQGAARGVPLVMIDARARLLNIRDPDATILLDLDPEVGLNRARQRNKLIPSAGAEGRFEEENLNFHREVRKAYLDLAANSSGRIRVISALGTPDEVFARITPLLECWLVSAR